MHPTEGSAAAYVPAESATVTRSDSVDTATEAVPSPVLREGRDQRQRQDERRNGKSATHT